MKHTLKVSVSKAPDTCGLVTCRSVKIREWLLRALLGDRKKITVLMPGDSIGELVITEKEEGGKAYEQSGNDA